MLQSIRFYKKKSVQEKEKRKTVNKNLGKSKNVVEKTCCICSDGAQRFSKISGGSCLLAYYFQIVSFILHIRMDFLMVLVIVASFFYSS